MFGGEKYDIFISYRRKSATAEAVLLYRYLMERGYRVFIDMQLHSGPFPEQLRDRVNGCKNLLLVCTSPMSEWEEPLEGDWLYAEVKTAYEGHKKIIPVLFNEAEIRCSEASCDRNKVSCNVLRHIAEQQAFTVHSIRDLGSRVHELWTGPKNFLTVTRLHRTLRNVVVRVMVCAAIMVTAFLASDAYLASSGNLILVGSGSVLTELRRNINLADSKNISYFGIASSEAVSMMHAASDSSNERSSVVLLSAQQYVPGENNELVRKSNRQSRIVEVRLPSSNDFLRVVLKPACVLSRTYGFDVSGHRMKMSVLTNIVHRAIVEGRAQGKQVEIFRTSIGSATLNKYNEYLKLDFTKEHATQFRDTDSPLSLSETIRKSDYAIVLAADDYRPPDNGMPADADVEWFNVTDDTGALIYKTHYMYFALNEHNDIPSNVRRLLKLVGRLDVSRRRASDWVPPVDHQGDPCYVFPDTEEVSKAVRRAK